MRKTIYVLCVILIFCCCNNAQEKQPEKKVQNEIASFNLDSADFTVLMYTSDWYGLFENAQPSSLTENELIEIEEILKRAVYENNEQQKENLKAHNLKYPKYIWTETRFELTLGGYRRQYMPIINENGEKEIWVNFFCGSFGSAKWETDPVIVMDGGNCYFSLIVNLTTKSYSGLGINGYA